MEKTKGFKFLAQRPGSSYRQLFVKGTRIRAETVYRKTLGPEPLSPQEVAEEYGLPLEAVLEAIDYAIENEDLLRQEREEELASIRARGLDKPPFVPPDYLPES